MLLLRRAAEEDGLRRTATGNLSRAVANHQSPRSAFETHNGRSTFAAGTALHAPLGTLCPSTVPGRCRAWRPYRRGRVLYHDHAGVEPTRTDSSISA